MRGGIPHGAVQSERGRRDKVPRHHIRGIGSSKEKGKEDGPHFSLFRIRR